ncbi:uncharacterized protein LOC100908483 [Galendromus occidentalis]|uniref:Uncharacterized protein LOC100908483 n=1 Tax=Galendromus occidentalis TaxID=34638 RepID=A0AAJ6QMY7_9ACAR|nr:uncharacterized protein LOC100908483 [Galendromus occidentalis]
MYMSFFTPSQPHEDPPVCRFLASCLVIMGFTTGTALVALFFYMGFAYGIDEGFMLGVFALGSWVYGLVTYCCKTGCFRPLDESDRSTPSSIPSSSSLTAFPTTTQDPPSYKEVTEDPPSYQEALKMIQAKGQCPVSTQCEIPKHQLKFPVETCHSVLTV